MDLGRHTTTLLHMVLLKQVLTGRVEQRQATLREDVHAFREVPVRNGLQELESKKALGSFVSAHPPLRHCKAYCSLGQSCFPKALVSTDSHSRELS